jgi:hypothetical protein
MNNIICVLKSGGVYDVQYVERLYNSCNRNITIPYKFTCLSDISQDEFSNNINVIPLQNDLRGWWSKIEMFKIDNFSSCKNLFFDLDTVIINNIDFFFDSIVKFSGLEDFYRPQEMGSGVLLWYGNSGRRIYTEFMKSPNTHIANNRYGDQEFISDIMTNNSGYLQTIFPNKIISYKKHYLKSKNNVIQSNVSSVICFHGQPKPHNCNDSFISDNWR